MPSMYIKTNVVKPTGKSPGAAAPKDPNVTIVAVDDILSWPMRDGKGVNHTGSFTMKTGAKMYQVYMTPSTIKAGYESDGEEDNISFKHKFEGEHPGNELEIAEFVQNWTGVNAIIIYGSCSDSFKKIVGTKCAPVQLKPSLKDDKDSRVHTLVFEQFAKTGFVPGHYTGSLIFADPFDVTEVAPFDLNTGTNGLDYRMPASDAGEEITIHWASCPPDAIITLIGRGGSDPVVLNDGAPAMAGAGNTDIILTSSPSWVALEGATISLKAVSGAVKNYFLEVSRS